MNSFIYDNHTLYIKCDCASTEQIRQIFNEAFAKYNEEHKAKLTCNFRVNLVENRNGDSLGIAYVFLVNSEAYHLILGKNPDGSDRIEYHDDPSWSSPTEDWTSATSVTLGSSWGDIAEEEFSRQNKKTCPKIPIHLDPLIELGPYYLTEKQINAKREKIIFYNEGKDGFDPSQIEIPTFAYLSVQRAHVSPVEDKFMPNILKCTKIPQWVSKETLKVHFTPYASDSVTTHERFVKGSKIEEAYPWVNINSDRVAFIIFQPNTYDAQFALHMMKKTVINRKSEDGKIIATETLLFNHSYRTDRDAVTEINQKPRIIRREGKKFAEKLPAENKEKLKPTINKFRMLTVDEE